MLLRKRPVLCNYYVTYRCNATCSFCDIWEKPSPYVTLEHVKTNLEGLKRLGVRVVDFTGGEPLLHRELGQILAMAKGMGFITTVTTNALLYAKRAKELAGLVDMLHFSLDYASATAHDASRGVKCFDALIEGIAIAKELGERPDILCTVFGKNVGEIKGIYEQITKPNGLVLILNPAFEYGGLAVDEALTAAQLEELKAWGQKPLVYMNEAFLELRKDGGNQMAKPVCRAATTTIVISPENKLVLPCYHLGMDEIAIDGDLASLYLSDKVQRLVKLEGRLPACQGCTINCYMQPSFAVETSKYWRMALPSTLKYNLMKGTWKAMMR